MILHDGRQSPRLAPNRPYMSHLILADLPAHSAPWNLYVVAPQLIRFATTLGPLETQRHVAPNRPRFPHGYGPLTVS